MGASDLVTANDNGPTGQAPRLPNSLTRGQLTAALVLVTLLPFCLVVVIYTSMPDYRDPVLNVNVSVGPRAWPNASDPEARIVPCVILKNPTDEPWNNLNMSVNHQFHFTHPDTVQPAEEIFVPLKFFHTKGNAFYPPESQELKELTIYAQISSGARAIVELTGEEIGFTGPKS